MHRRTFLAATAAVAASPALAAAPAMRTRWSFRGSEGLDALCFLGPLSGKPFYTRFYEAELAAFKPRFASEAQAALDGLQAKADAVGMLLGPSLCTVFSGGDDASLGALIANLDAAETTLLTPYRKSEHWDAESWQGFIAARPALRRVLVGMRDADFAGLRRQFLGEKLAARMPKIEARVASLDVIAEQERLLGRRLKPTIEVILLWFSKPHGIRIQGQRFLTHVDYPDTVVIRNAAHEVLHPPFPMDGKAAKAVLAVLSKDALLTRIVAEHDKSFGYNSLEGILNEDTVQALEQIVSDHLKVAVPPALRWAAADGGMHVLAAGLYGLFTAEGYDRTGGNLERWMLDAARSGKLAPASLHAAAARVLNRPADKLWPHTAA